MIAKKPWLEKMCVKWLGCPEARDDKDEIRWINVHQIKKKLDICQDWSVDHK